MIPSYPQFAPISLDMRSELHPHFLRLSAGISEFTFSNIFLFRPTYNYHLSKIEDGLYVISGTKLGKKFFSLPWGLPRMEIVQELAASHDFLKNLNAEQVEQNREALEAAGFEIREDRDNWDYLYDSNEMATLEGKRFHKKRNHIHQFFHTYPEGFSAREMTLSDADTKDALKILEIWQTTQEDQADYKPSREAIELRGELELKSRLWTLNGEPIGYAQGESTQLGKCFTIHFEKANGQHRGVYQAIFQEWALALRDNYSLINREQDLGEPGLRQAKETYRPVEFVRKFQVWPSTKM